MKTKMLWRRTWLLLLAVLTAVSSFPPYATVQAELREEWPSWAEDAIVSLQQAGIVHGYPDGSFGPNRPVTRAELAAWLSRLVGEREENPHEAGTVLFRDVSDEWFAREVIQAARTGIVSGYPDGTFRPNQPVKRQEAAVMLNGLSGLDTESNARFIDDNAIPDWASEHVYSLREAGILGGYPDGSFGGERTLTRAEAAVLLDRLLSYGQAERLRAVNAAGRPLADAEVYVHRSGLTEPVARERTDSRGELVLKLTAGEYDLIVAGDGEIAYERVDVPAASAWRAPRTLQTEPAAALTGTILGSDGEPGEGIVLALRTNPVFLASTEADGTFEAYVLPKRDYALTLLEASDALRSGLPLC